MSRVVVRVHHNHRPLPTVNMPYGRKSGWKPKTSRKGGYKAKPRWKKSGWDAGQNARKTGAGLPRRLNEHHFKRQSSTAISPITATLIGTEQWAFFAYTFDLADISASQELTDLYDTYRINGVRFEIMLPPQAAPGLTSGQTIAECNWFEDLTDATVPTAASEFTQRAGNKVVEFGQDGKVSIYLKPKPVTAMYNGTDITPAFASTVTRDGKAPFIATAYPGVPHYGLKVGIRFAQGFAPPSTQHIQLTKTYYVTMKDPK